MQEPSFPLPSPQESRGHVLVVEDNPHDLHYIVRLLQEHGYTPHPATEAWTALAFVAHGALDLVLLDLHLPGIDGYELCRRLKLNPSTKDVPVIFVSAENRSLDRVKAFADGAVDFITKPIEEAEALARIETHLALRRLATRLVEEKERAERANQAKSDFLAHMSHELRTPLNAVLGYAQILKMGGDLSERQTRGVDAIHESGEHLLRLINDILDIARIETGRLQLLPAPTRLADMLRFVSELIRVTAVAKGIVFSYETRGSLPDVVIVDEKRVSQVLINLLGNAVKFTSQGSVTLVVEALDEQAGAARLRFEVEDTGPGIPDADLDRVFQPFEQGGGGAQQRAGGAGLGLTISRRIIQMMGADVRVQSALGQGSRFWFDVLLPVEDSSAALEAHTAPKAWAYQGPCRTVLVVDDIAANRDITVKALHLAGLHTLSAGNGQEALSQLEDHSVDLVIMDICMPGVDGLETIARLRRTPKLAQLPIIAVSASSYHADRERALAAGANAFLPKPLNFQLLFQWMCTLAGGTLGRLSEP